MIRDANKTIPWPEIVEFVRVNHNGVMAVYLYFGHDGDNECRFADGDGMTITKANSGRTMQEAVERCYYERHLANQSKVATGSGWSAYLATLGIQESE